jgi:hypothetical protein
MWPEVEQQMFKSAVPFQFGINWKRVGGGGWRVGPGKGGGGEGRGKRGKGYLHILIRIEFSVLIIRFSVRKSINAFYFIDFGGGDLLFPVKLQKVKFYRYPSLVFPICWPGQHTIEEGRSASKSPH